MHIGRRVEWHASAEHPRPDIPFVSMLERRRLTELEQCVLYVAWNATDGGSLKCPMVFASRFGEIGTTLKLMRQMHDEGEMSPAKFSVSVHNAAPGAFTLIARNKLPYTAIAARKNTYEAGLIEAKAQLLSMCAKGARDAAILYVCAEETTPELYAEGGCERTTAHASAEVLVSDEDDWRQRA